MDSLNAIMKEMTRSTRVEIYLQSSKPLELKYNCPLCKDREYTIEIDDQGYEYAKWCVCREKRLSESRLSFAELPNAFKLKRLSHLTFSVFKQEKSKKQYQLCHQIAEKYVDEFGSDTKKGFYFYSVTKGSGKTAMATTIGAELLNKGYTVKFSTSSKILNEIKASWDNGGESKLLNDLVDVQILIIDDFGAEKTKDWINEKFFYLINERYLQGRVTMFTSNYALSDLDFDERIVDRVREMTYEIPFPEEGLRQNIADTEKQNFLQRKETNETN